MIRSDAIVVGAADQAGTVAGAISSGRRAAHALFRRIDTKRHRS